MRKIINKPKLLVVVFFSIPFLLVSSCAPNGKVTAREQAWKQKLEEFKPIGKTTTELIEWENKNHIPLNSYPDKNGTILETIEGDGFICTRWNIYLSIESNTNRVIMAYSVNSKGRCL